MVIDVRLRGWRFYLDLSPEAKKEPADEQEAAPTHLATPMRISTGFVTWEQIRAAMTTDARQRGTRGL